MELFQLLVAIKQVESTNNYRAVNPNSGALGAYQVMPYHLKDWGKQVFGRVLTRDEFLNSPQMQDKMASTILGEFYEQYGFDGAASMWFSGQSNPYSQKSDGGNTVQKYVDKVRAVLGMPRLTGQAQTATGTSSTKGTSSSSGGGGGKTPSIDPGVLARDYGFTDAMLKSIPDLKRVFDQAVKGGWDAKRFQAAVENTTWWKTTSKSQRDYILKSFTDPATFGRDKTATSFKINEMASQLGITDLMGTKHMDDLVWGVLYNGWSDAELKYHLAGFVGFSPEGTMGGAGGQFQQQMTSLAWANGVALNQNWYAAWYKEILMGNATAEQAQAWIRNQAAGQFPGFRDQILAGQNVVDIANPYIQSMGNILERNASEIDLFDKDIIGALNYKDPKTGVTGAKPLWQWEVDLRKDARWLGTNNAREGLMGVAHKVAQDMGVLF